MSLSNIDKKNLQQFEESLWIAETRYDRDYMEAILHSDFVEFGCSGKRYSRTEIIDVTGGTIRVKLPFDNFMIREISDAVVHITYISEVQYEELRVCNRTSIWVEDQGRWRLHFHQGTPTHYM